MCTGCEELFSGLLRGFVSLAAFILVPLMQIFLAAVKIIFEKIGLVKK